MWGARIKFTASSIIASIGMNIKKNVWLVIYALNKIRVSILTKLNHCVGMYINNINNSVIIEILPLRELFILIFSGLNQTFFSPSLLGDI